jgi:hypothetical protein
VNTVLLFSFPRNVATSIATTVEGITDILTRLTRGIASVNVGKKFVIRHGLSMNTAMEATMERIRTESLILCLWFPLDSSGRRYCWRLPGIMPSARYGDEMSDVYPCFSSRIIKDY